MRMTRSAPWLCLLGVLLIAGGCESATDIDAPFGAYSLVTFEEVAVPGVYVQNESETIEVMSGSFMLDEDGTCSGGVSFHVTQGFEEYDQNLEWVCTWTTDGSQLSFAWGGYSLLTTGVFSDGRLSLAFPTGLQCIADPCPPTYAVVFEPL